MTALESRDWVVKLRERDSRWWPLFGRGEIRDDRAVIVRWFVAGPLEAYRFPAAPGAE